MDERHVRFLEAGDAGSTLLPATYMPIPSTPKSNEVLGALATLYECCGISSAARTVADLIHHFGSVVSLLKASAEEIVVPCEACHQLASLVAATCRLQHAALSGLLKKSRPRRFSALRRSSARGDVGVHRERRATPAASKSARFQRDAAKKTGRFRRTLGRAALLRWSSCLLAFARLRCASRASGLS